METVMNEIAGKGKTVQPGETVENDKTDVGRDDDVAGEARLGEDFKGVRRRRVRQGLRLTPAQRLKWLEEVISTFGRWKGRARTQSTPTP
jgi:hypothetical protein